MANKTLIVSRRTSERSNGNEKCVEGALVLILVNGKEAIKQFNFYMTEEERLEQLRDLNEKGSLFSGTMYSFNVFEYE